MAQRAWEGRRMRAEGGRPEKQAQDRGEGRRQSVRGADTADDDRAAPSRRASPAVQTLRDVLTAALRQRVRPARGAGPVLPYAPCGPYLRAMPGGASGPGAAGAVGRRDGGLWGVPPGAADGRQGAPGQLSAAWSSSGHGRSMAEPDAGVVDLPSVVFQMKVYSKVLLHFSIMFHGVAQARGRRPGANLSCQLLCLHCTRRYPLRHRSS
jgi:hypothetical protein